MARIVNLYEYKLITADDDTLFQRYLDDHVARGWMVHGQLCVNREMDEVVRYSVLLVRGTIPSIGVGKKKE